jgi:hypothetical protein
MVERALEKSKNTVNYVQSEFKKRHLAFIQGDFIFFKYSSVGFWV